MQGNRFGSAYGSPCAIIPPPAQRANPLVLEAGHSESHALRCLVNRWLAIGWRLWQDEVPYDEAYHLRRVAERQRPRR